MRLFSTLLLSLLMFSAVNWETDLSAAKQKAKTEHKLILLNFSGSDWCGPCIRMHKEIFESSTFSQYADSALVLVKADFPRLKKNKLTKEQQDRNDKLADRYNPKGIFPLTVILDESGTQLMSWEGYPNLSPEQFTNTVKDLVDARK
jgi:thioredoxin-related protein